jgi:uncharacterized protein YdiU (UPF0061 family)
VRSPRLAVFNSTLAESLGLNAPALQSELGASSLAGNEILLGAEPIAQAYAGHQFGHFTLLGDGRAILLGEHVTPQGERFDVQLKGAGTTPYSRRGDGRAALGPMLREYLISEGMHALGIPTTRSLAVVTTGEPVFRELELPGAILTRVASSHIRVGTFEYFAYRRNQTDLELLARYTIDRHFPELLESNRSLEHSNDAQLFLEFLRAVMERQASLIAQWQAVGFIHGVMNTDNMAISGQTIDYGPCAFMDTYDPQTVFSSIDRQGRYAYANQPHIAQWNLAAFAETLLPLLHQDPAQALSLAKAEIESFPATYQRHWMSAMRSKLGLFNEESDDLALIERLLSWMHENQSDFTQTLRALCGDLPTDNSKFYGPTWVDWHSRWQKRLERQPNSRESSQALMLLRNPIVIPRNHRVEEALTAAVENSDFSVMNRLLNALKTPYEQSPLTLEYSSPGSSSGEACYQTFCGT